MKHLAFLIFVIASSFVSVAQTATVRSEASNCTECFLPPTALLDNAVNARNLRNTVTNGSEPQSISQISQRMNWANSCSKFASGNTYGPWGLAVIAELESNKYDELIRGSSDLKQICPGYQQMDRDGKNGMWVAILAAMANHESSCKENPPLHSGPNGTLVGLMQLHLGKERVYSPSGCKNGDGKTAIGSIRCTMSMLNNQLSRGDALFTRQPYWEVLKVTSKKKIHLEIQDAIQGYALCR